jgi:hypothetical protein
VTVVSDAPARESTVATRGRRQWLTAAAVGGTLAVGFALFAYTRSDMWLDEAQALNIARLPLGDLRQALEHDGAPPLYYALLHVWTGVLGDGDVAARSLSALFGVGAVVGIWFAAKRLGGSTLAWVAAVVMAASPFAIRYATEARMYMLEVLLVTWGIVAVDRALERPAVDRLIAVGALAALLVYTQYWAFYLLGVVGAVLVIAAWRDETRRPAFVRVVIAIGVGVAMFAPWLPTFLSQREHTGTPWGDPVLPGLPIGETLLGFAGGEEQEGWLLLLVLLPLLALGVFGVARDRTREGADDDRAHLELDLRVPRPARWIALVGGGTLVVGTSLSYLAGQAFEPRYSAIVFPFFVLLVARGITMFRDTRVRAGVLAAVVALGFVGGMRNATEQRTQAGKVAAVLRAEAQPGDLVVYCPDQLGPAVARLAPGGLDQVTFPEFAPPQIVDWVDYEDRIRAVNPDAFVTETLTRAGNRTIWYVTGPGYPTHAGACEAMSDALAGARPRTIRVLPDEDFFEKPGLQQFASPRQ